MSIHISANDRQPPANILSTWHRVCDATNRGCRGFSHIGVTVIDALSVMETRETCENALLVGIAKSVHAMMPCLARLVDYVFMDTPWMQKLQHDRQLVKIPKKHVW